MQVTQQQQKGDAGRYAKCIEVSKRIRWDIDRDVIRGRRFDFSRKFLPDGISKVNELEWRRENANLSVQERDRAVDDLIALVAAVDGLLQLQAGADADHFLKVCGRKFGEQQQAQVRAGVLKAYRWQYIVSGVEDSRFQAILGDMITSEQAARIGKALAPIVG